MSRLFGSRAMRLVALLTAVAAVLVAAAAAGASPAKHVATKDNTITVGLPGIPPVFLGVRPYVALQQGYYKKWGVDVQLKGFTTGTDAVRAVQAGQIDAAWSPTPFA